MPVRGRKREVVRLCVLWLGRIDSLSLVLGGLALAVGIVKAKLVFGRIADRNIKRINELSPHKEKICLFAFQAIQSYVVVIVMIGLGILLRSSPVPKDYVAAIYLAIGSALLLASRQYWKRG